MEFWDWVLYGSVVLVAALALSTFLYIVYRMLRGSSARDWIHRPTPGELEAYQARLAGMGEERVIAVYQRRRAFFWKAGLAALAGLLVGALSSSLKLYAWGTGLTIGGFVVGVIGIAAASLSLRCPVCGYMPSMVGAGGFQALLQLEQCEICGARLAPRD